MTVQPPLSNQQAGASIISHIQGIHGQFDLTNYRQLIGAANPFKEGDATLNVAAKNEEHRQLARQLLANTSIQEIDTHVLFEDEVQALIKQTTKESTEIANWTLGELKSCPAYQVM